MIGVGFKCISEANKFLHHMWERETKQDVGKIIMMIIINALLNYNNVYIWGIIKYVSKSFYSQTEQLKFELVDD